MIDTKYGGKEKKCGTGEPKLSERLKNAARFEDRHPERTRSKAVGDSDQRRYSSIATLETMNG
jgi:hypothetical protein